MKPSSIAGQVLGLFLISGMACLVSVSTFALETVEVGRKAAAKHLAPDPDAVPAKESSRGGHNGNFLMLHMGAFHSSEAYVWKGSEKRRDVGASNYGMTYLYDDFGHGMDMNLRVDFIEFKLDEVRPFKMTVMPLITFPRVDSGFPLYFGIGTGLGIFFRQVEQESSLSFDYQLLLGLRFVNVINTLGFFVEFGMKNHLHLLSDGQFNGNTLSAGLNFSF